jgi:hypothetical protein
VEQIAPKIFAEVQFKVAKLKAGCKLSTPFPNSIFTTVEISFCDMPNLSHKNWDATFYGLEVITSCGNYDWQEQGGLISWDNDCVIPLPPGTTVVFPAGTKRFSFIPVTPDESTGSFATRAYSGGLKKAAGLIPNSRRLPHPTRSSMRGIGNGPTAEGELPKFILKSEISTPFKTSRQYLPRVYPKSLPMIISSSLLLFLNFELVMHAHRMIDAK